MAEPWQGKAWLGTRIGCQQCDLVARVSTENVPCAELHDWQCPQCGHVGYVHVYPIPGTWPSETEPTCKMKGL